MGEAIIENIIFDLGGVIINLDMQRSYLALMDRSELQNSGNDLLHKHINFFHDYERGLLMDQEFRDGLRQHFEIIGSDVEIDTAWNQMLLDIPKERIDFIQSLKGRYRLFVLSNTCQIHVDYFEKQLSAIHGLNSLKDLFERVYYSHETGFRKPMSEIYELVLEENKLDPTKSVFIDDNPQNIETANKLGIIGIQMEQNGDLKQHFSGILDD